MIVDANVILRYLLDFPADQASLSQEILENEQVLIPIEVLSEVVYVLEKVYKSDRETTKDVLKNLINFQNISIQSKELIYYSLEKYSKTRFDFVDCLLCGYKNIKKENIYTFDKSLKKELDRI